ncbi:uncharacterized protein [Diadema antillarum]|uniref:uncharacterized protein n=1 Tax=Diadema antillarum TaxID=105358 RepID=UPI003A865BA3
MSKGAHRELYTQLLPLHPRVQTQVITMSIGSSTGSCESDREPPVVLVLGHSYIGSLNSFIERDPSGAFLHNVGHTQPGNVFSASSQLDLVWELSPDAVVIDLGSNDLCELGATTESTVTALLDLALRVSRIPGVRHVIVCGIIPRLFVPKWKTNFNAAVHDTNRLLAKFLENLPNVHFWRHRAFTQNHSKLFMQDGVHFNEAGMLRYFRSIRGAVMKACKMD